MKTRAAHTGLQAKNITRVVLGTLLILLIPFVAMQFTNQVSWSVVDFVTMGILLLGTGLAYELVVVKAHRKRQLIAALTVLGAIFIYIWAELAVGIFTNLGS